MNASSHDDTTSIAIIETKLDALTSAVQDIKASLAHTNSVNVSRAEWELRNALVDERFVMMADRAERTEQDAKAKRAPWWSALAVILAAIALGWTILGPAILTP